MGQLTVSSRPTFWARAALLFILAVGAGFRLAPTLESGWIVGDGGLFVEMARALWQNGFALPHEVFYPTNTPFVPFTYPPLAFYGAALGMTFGFSSETIFRFWPALWSVLSLWFFYRLSRVYFEEESQALWASLFYALWFYAFLWGVQGGGLTRAPSLCFALAALEGGLRCWKNDEKRGFWLAAIFLGLAILTHLERAHFAVLSLGLFAFCFGESRRQNARQWLQIVGLALLLSAPWWGLCLWKFGLEPFQNARLSGAITSGFPFRLWRAEPFLPLFHVVALAGALAALWRREWFLPLWFGLVFLLMPRSASTLAAVPILWLGVRALFGLPKFRPLALGFLACWLAFGLVFAVRVVRPLAPSERAAMNWARQNTPSSARFLVWPEGDWATDLRSEWFPALAGRASVATVQGSEWLPNREFAQRLKAQAQLRECQSWREITALAAREKWRFDYFIGPAKIAPGAGWRLVHQSENLRIWQRQKPAAKRQTKSKIS